jgi:hypothetical protein
MRVLLILVGAMALIVHQRGDLDESGPPSSSVDDVVAIRCDDLESGVRSECVERYQAVFDSSDLDPVMVLRQHCTRWQNPWEEGLGEPPSACVERFGGWIES